MLLLREDVVNKTRIGREVMKLNSWRLHDSLALISVLLKVQHTLNHFLLCSDTLHIQCVGFRSTQSYLYKDLAVFLLLDRIIMHRERMLRVPLHLRFNMVSYSRLASCSSY